jgi:hypothetical protein
LVLAHSERKFFDILEEVKKEEQTTIETLFEGQKIKEQRSKTQVLVP